MASFAARTVLLEFQDCSADRISSEEALETALREAFSDEPVRHFAVLRDAAGLRAFLAGETRQVSVFTRPATRFAAADILFLREEKDRSRLFNALRRAFNAKFFLAMDIRRGNPAIRPDTEKATKE
jgi:S-adenosylmethionine/arginine decarboxylase-like enzyme